MIIIKDKKYKIKRKSEFEDAGIKHMTLVAHGDLREYDSQEIDFALIDIYENEKEYKGVIIMPHYCQSNNTTMFLLYIQDK